MLAAGDCEWSEQECVRDAQSKTEASEHDMSARDENGRGVLGADGGRYGGVYMNKTIILHTLSDNAIEGLVQTHFEIIMYSSSCRVTQS